MQSAAGKSWRLDREGQMRRAIWELSDCQCSVIGTCLSLEELRRLGRKTNLSLPPAADEFTVHATFVKLSGRPGPVAKAVNKALNRKYAAVLRQFSAASDAEQLLALWQQARERGDIPGPYWAVLTHPQATSALLSRVFGEVHMLSHLVGAANRADIRRLSALETRLAEQERRYAATVSAFRTRLRTMAAEKAELRKKLTSLAKELETARTAGKEQGTEALRQENQALQRALGSQTVMLLELRSTNETLTRRNEAFSRRLSHLSRELAEKQAEKDFLEAECARLVGEHECRNCPLSACDKAGTDECPGPRLCGKRILYVGGRANLVQHYRALVEREGGEFVHHDGGLEQSRHQLPGLLGNVDAVLCPVDCVSHDACLRVKEACRHNLTPCKLLRSSGLSSLLRSLDELSANPITERRS